VKIDADITMQSKGDVRYLNFWQDWFDRFVLVGHRWGFTRVKGQENPTRHWLNILDDWWLDLKGEDPIFPADLPVNGRHGHRRINSFVSFHNTQFVRDAVSLLGDCKRLPVPSHDTFLWYVAHRSGLGVGYANVKKLGFKQ
jgi:hypothetical protein